MELEKWSLCLKTLQYVLYENDLTFTAFSINLKMGMNPVPFTIMFFSSAY